MPRPDAYYDRQLSQPATPIQSPVSGAVAPANSQKQLYQNINQTKAVADDAYFQKEANRSIWNRLPYEFASTLVNMPEEEEWNSYSQMQKMEHTAGEVSKLTRKMISSLPREILKAPLRLEQTFYDSIVKGLAAVTPGVDSEQVMKTLGRGRSYSLPWLGEIGGTAGGYQEGKAMGLSPFMSAVKATGELAGDLAISASLVDAGAAAFRPRIGQVKGTTRVTGEDFRPLSSEQVAKTKAYTSEGKIIKGEVFSPTQNPNISYIKLPKSAAKQYGGNSNNTFMKITPKGEGVAEYSIVQLRKSLVDTTIDAFKARFGRSSVSEGAFGPELKLSSGTIKYDSTSLVKQGNADAIAAKNSAAFENMFLKTSDSVNGSKSLSVDNSKNLLYNESVGSGWSAGAAPYVGVNVTEFGAMEKYFSSPEFSDFSKEIEAKANQYGVELSKNNNASGAWKDQELKQVVFEPSKRVEGNSFNPEVDRFLSDVGKTKNQQAIYRANYDAINPPGFEYGINFKDNKSAFEFIKTIEESGIEGVSFDDAANIVYIGDVDNSLSSKITNLYERAKQQGLASDAFRKPAEIKFIGSEEYDSILGNTNGAGEGMGSSVQPIKQKEVIDPFRKPKSDVPSIMSKPIKGFENSMVTGKQVDQILGVKNELEISDVTVQAISKVMTGKDNIYELTQKEAYDVSEAVRLMPDQKSIDGGDWQFFLRPWTHPARYWMESVERELGTPLYSEVFLPIETGGRLVNVFTDGWQDKSREIFGKYSNPKYYEERRMITEYIEGNKGAITDNTVISPETKIELAKIGDWLQEQYSILFKDLGITSKRFFEVYSPKIRKLGGINQLYKTDELPVEIKPFYEFEREGDFAPLEDDSLALFDIYTRAIAKKTYLQDPLEQAKMVIDKLPEGSIRKSANEYLQEKLGYAGKGEEYLNKLGESLSQKTGGFIPKDITKQLFDAAMTTSYAGALGLPRIMPLFRNSIQVLLTTYPDVGPEFFAEGVKRFFAKGGAAKAREKGFLVKMGVPYGAELTGNTGRGAIGRSVDVYKNLNKATMVPYGWTDSLTRGITYHAVDARFETMWKLFRDEKINYDEFEKGINMDGFNPTLQKVLRQKFGQNTSESLDEAKDLMAMDILDSTQFPYRKGSESRLFYGLKGKAGLQFGQWTAEYIFTLKSWISRGQWQKLIRWMGMGSAIKRSVEDTLGIDVSKWVNAPEDIVMGVFGGGNIGAAGPFSGFPIGPIGKITASAIAGFNASMTGMTEDVNKNWQDIYRAIQIYGGVLTGVGAKRLEDFNHSVKRYEAGIAVSPDPKKQFGIWSSTGKIIRWVDFASLTKVMLGFEDPEGSEQSERIGRIKKESVEYSARINDAMNYLVDGNFKKFDEMVEKNNLMIPDIATRMKSYQTPLDQRIFDQMPMELKVKYFNAFYPTDGQ